jgi:hypothetical protein
MGSQLAVPSGPVSLPEERAMADAVEPMAFAGNRHALQIALAMAA